MNDIRYEELTLVFRSEGEPDLEEIPADEFEKIMEEHNAL